MPSGRPQNYTTLTDVTSRTTVAGTAWFRQVAANPMAEADALLAAIETALG
jgi:hypothetical protein